MLIITMFCYNVSHDNVSLSTLFRNIFYLLELNLILLVAILATRKWCKNPEKMTETLAHVRVLSKSYLMNTNMTGFRWFSRIIASLGESSLSIGRINSSTLIKPIFNSGKCYFCLNRNFSLILFVCNMRWDFFVGFEICNKQNTFFNSKNFTQSIVFLYFYNDSHDNFSFFCFSEHLLSAGTMLPAILVRYSHACFMCTIFLRDSVSQSSRRLEKNMSRRRDFCWGSLVPCFLGPLSYS